MNEKEIREQSQIFQNSFYWKARLLPFLEAQGSTERLLGANKDNFEKVQSEVLAFREVLNLVNKDASID